MRIGFGYDVHALAAGESLILGGVTIESDFGTVAHSDGDVLAHAVTDALLGAMADGDIGAHYPDTDPKWKGADSIALLEDVARRMRSRGFALANLDATVAIQKPRLRPHIDQMRRRLAGALGASIDQVSVKATTTEKLGFEGRGEGISAYAVCLIVST